MPTLPSEEKPVTDIPAAAPQDALAHFGRLLSLETDPGDVHTALAGKHLGFVVLDVRGEEAYGNGHVPGSLSLPYRRITERNLAPYPTDTLFVVYCSGVHCNGADKAAARLARLGRPVKKMIGGFAAWQAEGFPLETA